MSAASDAWYIRLPDGRVLLARSTAAVRHHLESGAVPLDSRVRRSPLDAWSSLEKVEAFADLATFALGRGRRGNGQRPPPVDGSAPPGRGQAMALESVGVRALATELTSALDSTLVRTKLVTAALTGLAAALVLLLGRLLPEGLGLPGPPLLWVCQGLVLLVVLAWCTTVIGGLTYVELAHLRLAHWSEATAGLARNIARLSLAYLVVCGGVLLGIILLRLLPEWLLTPEHMAGLADGRDALAAAATVLALVLEVILWPVLGFALLLGPIIVVEGCSAGQAVRQWAGLLRAHLGRVFLYEALAAAVAGVAALPFIIPVELAAWTAPTAGAAASAADVTVWLLRGLALTPAIAYLTVANVFIYLTLRYEHTPGR
jgi:hypothetical protein